MKLRLAFGVVLAAACGGRAVDGDVPLGCNTDLECKGDRICVAGRCEDAALGASGGRTGAGGSAGFPMFGGASFGGSPFGMGGASFGSGGSRVSAQGGATSGTGGASIGATPTRLDIDASALIADPLRARLYATVRGNAASHGNEVVVIDARLDTVLTSLFVGSDPDSLALSDDGTRLWVGLHGALSIREVDLTQFPPVAGAQYVVPPGDFAFDAVHAGPMVVLPGEPESVAISLHYDGLSPSFAGLAVIDSGNPREKQTPSHTGASRLTGGPPGFLFGFNDQHTGFEFFSIAVDASGVTQSETRGLVDGFSSDIRYDGGYVVATSGQVVDVTKPSAPVRAGKFPFTGQVVPHGANSRVLMLSSVSAGTSSSSGSGNNMLVLRNLNLSTFREDGETPINGRFNSVQDFVEAAPGVFAFIDANTASFGSTPSPSNVYVFSVPEFAE
ncbi:MAG TPA: hypothetical protein VFQ35_02065 [Polyangiaceae bacterium]|nr:hypothetical protein [Polyangiaceae bacterium]